MVDPPLADLSLPRRYSAGTRALVVATAAIILLCSALIYTRQGSHPSFLFFFLPVAAAVVLGAWVGLTMAVLAVVGWVSKRRGSLTLTQGLGGRAIRAIEGERRRTAQGMSNADIARALFVTTKTIKYHPTTIFGKSGVHNRTKAAASAIAMGLTSPWTAGGPESPR